MTLPTWPHYITLTLSPLGMAVGTAQHLILPWLYLIHSLNINSRYQHQAKGLGGYVYTLKWRRTLGLSMAPKWMAMRDWESSFFLACGETDLSIFGHDVGGTDHCTDVGKECLSSLLGTWALQHGKLEWLWDLCLIFILHALPSWRFVWVSSLCGVLIFPLECASLQILFFCHDFLSCLLSCPPAGPAVSVWPGRMSCPLF